MGIEPTRDVFSAPHRIRSPEQTFELYRRHISPITGLINYLTIQEPPTQDKRSKPFPNTLRVFISSHAHLWGVRNLNDLKPIVRSSASLGKGHTEIQAKTSCLCEALERTSGIFRGSEPRLTAPYSEVKDKAYHPHELLQYSERQYRERDQWNALGSHFCRVTTPYDESREIEWSPVWSLTNKRWKLVPTRFLYYRYYKYQQDAICYANSNGNAAGNCLEEAILQGIMELVERDAVAIWWYNMLQMPALDLQSTGDPLVAQFVREEDFQALTPLFTLNINPYGYFALDFDKPSILEAA